MSDVSDSARRAAEEIALLEKPNHSNQFIPEPSCDICNAYRARIAAIISKYFAAAPADNDAELLLQHVAYSGVEFDDNRMGYVVVQIDRDVWERIKKLAPTPTKGDR